MTDFKPGSRWLLPVKFNENDDGAFEFEDEFGAYIWIRHEGVGTLIPASTLTDLQAENAKLREACIGVSTSLIAAIWLLKNGGKKAAGSDKIFEISVADYERNLDAARAVLSKLEVD